jgi:tetratricopeptide (TPR) repeat protein
MHNLLSFLIALFTLSAVKSNFEQYSLFRKGNTYALSGKHTLAVQSYRKLLDNYPAGILRSEASFNLAVTEFGMKHYQRSADQFASIPPGNSALIRNAGYNRGNALAMEAFTSQKASSGSNELLGRALSCYRRALLDNPQNSDARINYEIVSRALHRTEPPPPSPSPQGSGGASGDGNTGKAPGSAGVTGMILEKVRQEEARQMQRYFRPLPSKTAEHDHPDW